MRREKIPSKAAAEIYGRNRMFFVRDFAGLPRITQLAPVTFLTLLFPGGGAQAPATRPATPGSSTTLSNEDPLGRETRYGCVVGFLKYASRGDYAHAAECLDLRTPPSRAEERLPRLDKSANDALQKR